MKIIDLLNKIANGEGVPKKIKVNEIIFEYQGDDYLYKDEDKNEHWLFSGGYTDRFEWLDNALNTEVETLEEEKKIPEKLETYKENNEIFLESFCYKNLPIHKDSLSFNEQVIVDKLNEVLDYLKSKGE